MPEVNKRYPKVEIIWEDAAIEEAHIPLEGVKQLTVINRCNVGYLIIEDESKLIIAYGLMENLYKDSISHEYCFEIPRGMIKKIKRLR